MYYITSKCTRPIAARGSAVSVTFTVRFQTVYTNHLTHKRLYIDIPYRHCGICCAEDMQGYDMYIPSS
jgi:hypothetical protein